MSLDRFDQLLPDELDLGSFCEELLELDLGLLSAEPDFFAEPDFLVGVFFVEVEPDFLAVVVFLVGVFFVEVEPDFLAVVAFLVGVFFVEVEPDFWAVVDFFATDFLAVDLRLFPPPVPVAIAPPVALRQ